MDGQVAIEIGYMLIQPPTKLELELGLSLEKNVYREVRLRDSFWLVVRDSFCLYLMVSVVSE